MKIPELHNRWKNNPSYSNWIFKFKTMSISKIFSEKLTSWRIWCADSPKILFLVHLIYSSYPNVCEWIWPIYLWVTTPPPLINQNSWTNWWKTFVIIHSAQLTPNRITLGLSKLLPRARSFSMTFKKWCEKSSLNK